MTAGQRRVLGAVPRLLTPKSVVVAGLARTGFGPAALLPGGAT